jgi:hypothetical protein
MHRLEGVVIYFFFLCLFYRIITAVCRLIERLPRESVEKRAARADPVTGALVPLFWYGAITLAVPMLNGAMAREGARFAEHGGMVISGSLGVLAVLLLIQLGWQGIKRLKMKRA